MSKRSVKNNGFYPRLLCTKKICENRSINPSESFTEAKHSCRVTFDKYGRYHICIPIETSLKRVDNQERLGVVALDPGVRTFQSYYNKYICGEWGKNDWKKIMRLCFIIDKLCSEIVKAKSKRRKRLRKARSRIQLKVKNLVNELHNKLINFLCLNFDVILIPEFKTKYMVKKLFSKIARSMLTLSHYTFKEKLKNKAKEHGCIVIEVNESYTSKTCGNCGYVNKKSKSKTFDCGNCKVKIDSNLIELKILLNSKNIKEQSSLIFQRSQRSSKHNDSSIEWRLLLMFNQIITLNAFVIRINPFGD